MRFDLLAAALALLSGLACPALAAEEEGARGRRLFDACAPCHSLTGVSGDSGPTLAGVFGRPAGSLEDFRFSRAMSRSGVIWTEQTLTDFLEAPQSYVKGTRMPFSGMPDREDRMALVAYLKSLTGRDAGRE